jgi:hypothetical protein
VSFRLFIYYSAICGAWAALIGRAFVQFLIQPAVQTSASSTWVTQDMLLGCALGLSVALVLGVLDTLWELNGYRYGLVLLRGAVTGLIGAIAAGAGTAVGLLLVRWLPSGFGVVVGWMVTGSLIGIAVGVCNLGIQWRMGDRSGGARRKLVNGSIGGSIGGLIGGSLFLVAGLALPALLQGQSPVQLISPGFLGFAALGASIGLFVGLARVIMKTAWLRIETGRRAGCEWILSKDVTTIGRAETSDIAIFGDAGVERIHARVILKDDRYLLRDAGTEGGTYLNEQRIAEEAALQPGDCIRVGRSVVRFRAVQRKKARASNSESRRRGRATEKSSELVFSPTAVDNQAPGFDFCTLE